MAGLSRRGFLAASAAVASMWAIPFETLAQATAARAMPTEKLTTLLQTIRVGSIQRGQYRGLTAGPGEAHVARFDLLGKAADPARVGRRRSLLYMGHLSDIHIIDAQSPARLEPLVEQSHALWGGAMRPQDTLTTHVAAEMVQSVSDLRVSPITGAPLAAAFITGDSADMLSHLETRWYIDILDGKTITPNSGKADEYEGVQGWSETFWAYHPEDPKGDWFGDYGFPTVTGMLEAAVSRPVKSVGLPVPWFAVYGNHDSTYFGTFGVPNALRDLAVSDKKFFDWKALGLDYVSAWATDPSAITRAMHELTFGSRTQFGAKTITADANRKLLEQQDFMHAHFETAKNPGPVGHGFTKQNLATGKTYWSADVTDVVRVFGLDTCNQVAGADGAVPEEQFEWLREQLALAQAQNKLAIILSHHNSFTLENDADLATDPQRLIHADEFVAMLLEYPNMVAWLNGHTHINTITAHRGDAGRGFWEITTASCIDFPQQQQMVELVDNRDGTLSIFTTALDHAAPIQWNGDLNQSALAGLSRELSANDWIAKPNMRIGSELDRNTELVITAPFDLSRISDAQLEQTEIAKHGRLMSWESGWAV